MAGIIFGEARHYETQICWWGWPLSLRGKNIIALCLINAQGQEGGLYHKQALVPFAETTPLAAWGIDWGRGYHFSSGNKPGVFALSQGSLLFGVVICSESAHPSMVRQLRRPGQNF